MKSKSRFQISLFLSGSIILIVSILHGIQHGVFKLGQANHLENPDMIYLFNWCVALLLCFMAVITLIAAKSKHASLSQMKILSWILMASWSCRLVLEILYPVSFRFLTIDQPSHIIKVAIVCLLSILMFPFISFENRLRS